MSVGFTGVLGRASISSMRPIAVALLSVLSWCAIARAEDAKVTPVPDDVRKEFKLAPFYKKYVSVGGVPIVASEKVNDAALLEARFLVEKMVGHRPEVLTAIAKNNVRLAIMAPDEFTTDIPEHSDLRPRSHWDKRARGLGATAQRPATSCGEENLLCYPGDPYAAENILIHEFGHVVHERGMNVVDPTFDQRLKAAFEAAKEKGLWAGKYAGTNRMEYWAEGTQSWFDTNRENDHDHNHVNTRGELKEYDPALAALCAEVYGEGEWRYQRPAARQPAPAHLAGYDPTKAPKFSWKTLYDRQRERGDEVALNLLPADARKEWKSGGGGKAVGVDFSNQTRRNLIVEWMDFEGAPKQRQPMRPGVLEHRQSFTGHIFRVSEEEGKVLGYFEAGEKDGTAVIR
jgi:hypothetical protein